MESLQAPNQQEMVGSATPSKTETIRWNLKVYRIMKTDPYCDLTLAPFCPASPGGPCRKLKNKLHA